MTLNEKILGAFAGKVVRKDLAFQVKGNLPVPTYVLEYLLGQYCAGDDPQMIDEGLETVKSIIRNNYVNRADAEIVKGRIHEKGRYRVIDKVSVVLNERMDCYTASFANLGLSGVPISTAYVTANEKLLSGNGVWCIVTVGYIPGEDVKIHWEIQTLKPIQISNVDLDDYISQRRKFTTEEWMDFLVHTVGLNPEPLNRREKLIVLSRLLPHIENNFNFMELGPKGTGKSHVFQELSPYGVLVSGGDVTSARLFVKMSGNREILGLVGYWDVVAWDEYEQQKGKSVDPVLIDTMQNYLANKSFNRGGNPHEACASVAFVGNTKHTVSYMLEHSHLFESIPTAFIKGAFLDRIHLYNPGWEVKTLKKNSFSTGYGLITDYIAAVLHALRGQDFSGELKKYVKFDPSLSERDHLAIRKTFSGLVKLLYPDGRFTHEEALELIDFAAEGRKRVKDQLYAIDETFRADRAKFEYTLLSSGEVRTVETLERLNFAVPAENLFQASPQSFSGGISTPAASTAPIGTFVASPASPSAAPSGASPSLMSSVRSIRLNQTGVTYEALFGDYLRTAKHITLVDPFIRYGYQIDNFLEFVQCAWLCSAAPEDLVIHLSTQNDDDKIPEMIDTFDEIQDDLAAHGISFTYDFQADHDRYIDLDNGWRITLGRGLDIYEKHSRFSLDALDQRTRRCKEFNIAYNKIV